MVDAVIPTSDSSDAVDTDRLIPTFKSGEVQPISQSISDLIRAIFTQALEDRIGEVLDTAEIQALIEATDLSDLAGSVTNGQIPDTIARDSEINRLRFGSGAPASTLGADNDAYVNTTDGGLYLKASGTWSLQFTPPAGTGGSDTAAQILAKLLTVDGTGSGLDADLLDGMTPAEVAALGGGGSSAYYPIANANVGGTANAITLTTGQSLAALTGGMLFFFNSTNTNTGPTTINVDGIGTRNLQRSRPRGEGANINTGSEALEGGEITNSDPIMVVYGSQFNEFYLLPSRAGTAAYRNVGTNEFDIPSLGAGGDLADGVIPAGIARTTALAAYAALAGATFSGAVSGITPTADAHLATKEYVDSVASGGTTPGDHTRRAAISDDETLEQAEVNAGTSDTDQTITVPTWSSGRRFIYIGVPENEDDITGISSGGIDVFHAWERVAGMSFGHKWWKTINSQSSVASGATYTITEG